MAARLIVLTGKKAGTRFELGERAAGIGRDGTCVHRFEPDEIVVSGHHATVFLRDGRWVIRDESSRNGTFIDGQMIDQAELVPGQVISFGRNGPTVRFEGPLPAAPEAGLATVAEVIPGTSLDQPPAQPVPPPAAASPPPAGTGLTVLYQLAREQAGASGDGNPSQMAVVKAFVKLAQERSARRARATIFAVIGLGLATSITVYVLGERKAASLDRALRALSGQLTETNDLWQRRSDSLEHQLQRTVEEAEQERRELARARAAVSREAGFGPVVAERFSGGVGLIDVQVGWFEPSLGWLRLRPSANGDVALTTAEGDIPALSAGFQCTGFLIDPSGVVVTNRHCVQMASSGEGDIKMTNGLVFRRRILGMRIAFPPGRIFQVALPSITMSREHDVAWFRLTAAPSGVPVLALGRDREAVAGEDIVLLAYPGGTAMTLRRRLLNSNDTTVQRQLAGASRAVVERFDNQRNVAAVLRSLPSDSAGFVAAVRGSLGLSLLLTARSAVEQSSLFDGLAAVRQVQPNVNARLSVTGVRPTSISYQTLGGIGGSSGGPVIGSEMVVIGVNHAFLTDQDRGAQYQQNEAVPVDFVWQILRAGTASSPRGE